MHNIPVYLCMWSGVTSERDLEGILMASDSRDPCPHWSIVCLVTCLLDILSIFGFP